MPKWMMVTGLLMLMVRIVSRADENVIAGLMESE